MPVVTTVPPGLRDGPEISGVTMCAAAQFRRRISGLKLYVYLSSTTKAGSTTYQSC